ncbi:MAG: hypothetical protein ACRENG_12775, partial [bacterium]
MDKLILKVLTEQQVGFAIIDRQWRVEEFNDVFARFVQSGEEATSGKRLDELYPEMVGLDETLSTLFDGPGQNFELPCVNREGRAGELCFLDFKLSSLPDQAEAEPRLLFMV